jgi:L-ascorbate metabolism protein UlaG (beta-lactamase superfamily)
MSASITFIWHGLSCFSIEARNGDACAHLVIDPFDQDAGLKLPRNLAGDLITISNDSAEHNNAAAVKSAGEKKPLVISSPGEYEVSGLFVYGTSAPASPATTLYRYEIGDLSFAHLGNLGTDLSDEQRELLEDIDILLVPVGDSAVLNAKKAVEIVTELEPRVVIPMHYAVPGLAKKLDPVEKFLKEMGAGSPERVSKFKAVKKDLPAEETKVVVLELD